MTRDDDTDPYDVLGVLPDAPLDVINSAYRCLSRSTHPDLRGGSEGANEEQKVLNNAHAVLKDPARRAEHDRQLESAFPGGPRTMSDARRRLASAESTVRSLRATLATESQRSAASMDAELEAQMSRLRDTYLPEMRSQAVETAWAAVGELVYNELAEKDRAIGHLTNELAHAESRLAGLDRPAIPREYGAARLALVLMLLVASIVSLLFWLWQGILVASSAWLFAPTATLWPAWLRNDWLAVSIVALTTLGFALAPVKLIQRESPWIFLWPALAGATWFATRSDWLGGYLWAGASDQIALYVIGYLSCFILGWLSVAVNPD